LAKLCKLQPAPTSPLHADIREEAVLLKARPCGPPQVHCTAQRRTVLTEGAGGAQEVALQQGTIQTYKLPMGLYKLRPDDDI
jgi:hypothetical protein